MNSVWMIKGLTLLLLSCLLISEYACKQKDAEEINDLNNTVITLDSLVPAPFLLRIYGKFSNLDGSNYPEYGICYSNTNQNPTINDTKVVFNDIIYEHKITDSLADLQRDTLFYMRLYIVDGTKVVYSSTKQVYIPEPAPVTLTPINISFNSATLQASVCAYGKSASVIFLYGKTIDYTSVVNATPATVTGNNQVLVSANLTQLVPDQSYHYRVKTIYEGVGIFYGQDMEFIATSTPPADVITGNSTAYHDNSYVNGKVTAPGGYPVNHIGFEYGTSISYGNFVNGNPNSTTSTTPANITAHISGLIPNTTYHYRITAQNAAGKSVGADKTFRTTIIPVPTVATLPAVNVEITTAGVSGKTNTSHVISTVTFEYGTTTSYGSSKTYNNVITTCDSVFIAPLQSLSPQTLYHYRMKVSNIAGTFYGEDKTFTTKPAIILGSYYQGGYVFYLNTSQEHGMICAPEDQEMYHWACFDNLPGNGTAFGKGYSNTQKLVETCEDNTPAFVCWELTLNGYDDWYLPSKDELNKVYEVLNPMGLGNFQNEVYWTSSQASEFEAWGQNMQTGVKISYSKAMETAVRAIRNF